MRAIQTVSLLALLTGFGLGFPVGSTPLSPPVRQAPARCSNNTQVDINATRTYRRFPEPNLVPWPRSITARAQYTVLGSVTIIVPDSLAAVPAARLLAADLLKLTSSNFEVLAPGRHLQRNPSASASNSSIITLAVLPASPRYSTLTVGPNGVALTGRTYEALVSSAATLLQALEFSGDADWIAPTTAKCSTPAAWRLPFLEIEDAPEFGFRGLMVDAARNYVPAEDLRRFVDICRFYKLNRLHIHLTDDQAFTFPSTAFPELATKSPFRYTHEELTALRAYAADRGVQIVGEMDVPGHATTLVSALPALFGFPSAPHLGIINFADKTVVARLQTILDEIDAVFQSPYVAIGGDEVDFEALRGLPEIAAALARSRLPSVSDLYRTFIVEMQRYARSRNKTLHVWEGFGPQGGQQGHKPANASSVAIPADGLSVTIFDGVYYNPPRLAADGYRIINSANSVLYINTPFAVEEMIYSWHPWLFGDLGYTGYESWWELPDALRGAVEGVQICAWGMSSAEMLTGMRRTAAAMSDRSWFPQAMRSYADFRKRVAASNAKLGLLQQERLPTGGGVEGIEILL